MHPFKEKCISKYEEAYMLSHEYFTRLGDDKKRVEPEFRKTLIELNKLYKQILSQLPESDIGNFEKACLIDNIIENNKRVAGSWTDALGLKLEKLAHKE